MAQTKKTATKTAAKKPAAKKSSSAPKKTSRSAPPPEPPQPYNRELLGVVFLLLAVFVVIGFFSTDGALIAFLANFVRGMVGWGFWICAPVFLFVSVVLFFHNGQPVRLRVYSALLLPVLFAAIAQLFNGGITLEPFSFGRDTAALFESGQAMASGGVLGGLLAAGLTAALSVYGAWPLLAALFALCLVLALRGNLQGVSQRVTQGVQGLAQATRDEIASHRERGPVTVPELGEEEPPVEQAPPAPVRAARAPGRIERMERRAALMDIPLGEEEEDALTLASGDAQEAVYTAPAKPRRARVRRKSEEPPVRIEPPEARDFPDNEDLDSSFRMLRSEETPAPLPAETVAAAEIADPPKKKKLKPQELQREAQAVAEAVAVADTGEAGEEYRFPPTSLLKANDAGAVDARDEIQTNRERLEGALHSFGISASIAGVTRGPTVTRYDIELEQGVKLARVTNLAGDLALALGVVNVRIAPIPDKISTVGIEVPNRLVSKVCLRDILESPRFTTAKSKLSFALGKDIGGECIVGNIAKLPHMLIAGTTGSGKSVCMNSLILSLLYKARPDEVRLIMIDPKMVELGVYNGIPHLYVPVVTDPKKAAGALQWSVVEMLKRYRAFSEIGVRDLESYNRHCRKVGEATLPAIVIVIDELADLMLVASKEVEESICRVAQMGRAAGMHLIIATQRPSADVITGLMKANIPSRIAFAVSSSLESRIILDQVGAEKLIGMGDMLFSPVGIGKPLRIQGAFVSDEEREDVIAFIKEGAGETQQNAEIEAFMNKATEDKGSDKDKGGPSEDSPASGYDEMLPQAVEVVLELGSCSVSMLQRRIKLGYARAARIVDQMEELGVVGPYEGAKPRSVVIDRAGWQELQVRLGLAADSDMALAAEMNETYRDGE